MANVTDYDGKHKVAENVLEGAGMALNAATIAFEITDTVSSVIVPFSKFIPLVAEVTNILDQIVELYHSAEHNKRICGALIDRVSAAEAAVPENDKKALRQDIDDLGKYLDEIGGGITDINKHVAVAVTQLNVINSTMEQLVANNNTKSQDKIDNLFHEERLKINDYEESHETRGNKKLRFAVDIARGLNFLRAIEIIHRDIRAENILITANETAKITNFKSSRSFAQETRKQCATQEAVRYLAPEMLGQRTVKYTTKCEVYSFDLVVKQKYREPFSLGSGLPKKYQEVAKEAVEHDPSYRPKLAAIFTTLQELYKNYGMPPASPRSSYHGKNLYQNHPRADSIDTLALTPQDEEECMIHVPDFSTFNYMTVDEASKQHKTKNAYYISHNYAEIHLSQEEREKIAAELFKEVADANDENPESQLRYGNCLYKGQGVPLSIEEAVKYFVKAADNGQVIGMYNAASLYFTGGIIKQDKKLGEYYMKLAAYKQHQPAIEFLKLKITPQTMIFILVVFIEQRMDACGTHDFIYEFMTYWIVHFDIIYLDSQPN
ncbi:unnamed protein product [Rhizophagus irregularis]|nr:unnamed protein product [Rhizophagus irregularis]